MSIKTRCFAHRRGPVSLVVLRIFLGLAVWRSVCLSEESVMGEPDIKRAEVEDARSAIPGEWKNGEEMGVDEERFRKEICDQVFQ